MRYPLVLLLMLFAACSGGGDAQPDAGNDVPPAGWTCEPRAYGDGAVCHCECGAPDPDCTTPGLIVTGCINNEVCTPAGTCSECGNGAVNAGEACDVALPAQAECGPLGFEPGQVPCNASCEWAYDQCAPLVTCGNGMLDPAELCEGTAIKPGLDCTDYNRTSGTLSCSSGCMINSSGCYTCGDGKIEAVETCDDGNTTNGNGCSSTCAPETGWQCSGQPSVCSPKCGDGMRVGNEACDDSNANSNDGCSATCQVEQDCTCSGTPSVCSCAVTQLITTTTQSIDTGSLALDSSGQPHAIYYYGIDYTDPVTNYLMEHGHAMYATRSGTSWGTSLMQMWDQTRSIMRPEYFALESDGGTMRAYFHRLYNTGGTFAAATLSGGNWQFAYDNPYYIYGALRGGGNWHALVAGSGIGDLRYYMGSPGAWTRNEPLTGFSTNYPARLGHASNGDVYLTTITRGSMYNTYNLKLSKRLNATTWGPVYDVQTTGTCVFPVTHEPLALANGEIMAFEDGFNNLQQRWLRAHVRSGTSWVVENVADLSFLSTSCSGGGASYSVLRTVTAADQHGRPHILYASPPTTNSLTFEDHYRDGNTWRVRKFPITKGTPLDMFIDAAGTTHILAIAPSSTPSTTRLLYIRISESAWQTM
ncbi:MAG TPA: DUF4215 domain-containing protein [Kofleriaceae bacterium]